MDKSLTGVQAVRVPPELMGCDRPAVAWLPLLPRQAVIQRALDAQATAGRTAVRPRLPSVWQTADFLPKGHGPWIIRQAGDRYLAKFIQPMNFKELRQRARRDPLLVALG